MPTVLSVLGTVAGLAVLVFVLQVIKRKMKCPEKTMFNCLVNEILTPMRMLGLGPFKGGIKQLTDMNVVLKYAMKKVKLSDYGDLDFVEHYNAMINTDVQQRQRFTNLGFIAARIELNLNFCRRLTMIQYFKDVPRVLSIPVRAPVFVMGLPRTGTTFLHRLLSLDPTVRAPLLWELLNPVPTPRNYDESPQAFADDRVKRAKFIRKIIATRKQMGDHALDHIHEIEYDLPEECLMGLTDSLPMLMQYLYSNYMKIESYLQLDSTKAYEGYKKLLQLLSYQCGEEKSPKRWMLKCPIHLFYIRQIAKVFPDAEIVWTHRHPISAVTSLCSLIKAFHSVYYEPDCLEVKALGRQIADRTSEILKKATEDIASCHLRNGNVTYNKLVEDPVGTVRSLYATMGWNFTDEYEEIMNAYLAENKLKRKSVSKDKGKDDKNIHHYSPSSYGLTETELCSGGYGEYIKMYDVPMSKN